MSSRFSNAEASSASLFDTESVDTLSYLPSDYLPLDSQQTIASTDATSLSQQLEASPPETLKRVGSTRFKEWVIYSDTMESEFLSWWFDTQFGIKKNVRWDGKSHYSEVWNDFDMVAHYITGEPKVRCKNCGKILEHPNTKKDGRHSIGTKSLARHINGPSCSKRSKGLAQPHIGKMMQKIVSILYRTLTSIHH